MTPGFLRKTWRAFAAVCLCAVLASCAVAVADYALSRERLNAAGITDQDLAELEAGQVSGFLARYGARDVATLTPIQLTFYCDVAIRASQYDQAEACLTQAARIGAMDGDTVAGKRALILLQQGQLERAFVESAGLRSRGGRYVHALAGAMLDDLEGVRTERSDTAVKLAERWRFDPDPGWAFLSANLFLAADEYKRAYDTLHDSETQLAPRHGITRRSNPEPLRIDPFGEFQFGLTEISVTTPASNLALQLALATALEGMRQYDKANAEIDALLRDPGAGAQPGLTWAALVLRGRIAEAQGRDDVALGSYLQAIDAVEKIRRDIDTEAGRLGFVRDKQEPYRRVVALFTAQGRNAEALEYSERARSRALVDLLQSRSTFNAGLVRTPGAGQVLADITAGEAALAAAVADRDTAAVERTRANLAASQSSLTTLAPDVANLITVQPLNARQLQDLVAPGETVVSYAATPDGFTAFVLTRTRIEAVPLARAGLREDAARFGELFLLVTPENYERDPDMVDRARDEIEVLAGTLYGDLIAPLAGRLGAGSVTIIPGDELHYVPFAALKGPRGYLIQERPVRVLPSLSVLAVLERKPMTGFGALVLGDPERPEPQLPALPSARVEAQQIAGQVASSDVLIGGQATEARFRELAAQRRYIHIAAHARFDPRDPLASAVYLTAGGGFDGNLTVNDLYDLTMGPEVVVLSGCETSRSRLYRGNELVGLIRGFFFAGARTYVGSLWQVPDESTQILMTKFYEQLGAGATPQQALRAAQIHVITTYDPEPYFWAAFQIYGV